MRYLYVARISPSKSSNLDFWQARAGADEISACINRKTANTLGVTVPPTLLANAAENCTQAAVDGLLPGGIGVANLRDALAHGPCNMRTRKRTLTELSTGNRPHQCTYLYRRESGEGIGHCVRQNDLIAMAHGPAGIDNIGHIALALGRLWTNQRRA